MSNNIDMTTIVTALEGKIPSDKIKDITMTIYKYGELQDHGDSPYTRPTFAKIALLTFLIVSVIIWVIFPLKTLMFSSTGINAKIEELEKDRETPMGEKFAYNVVIEENLNGEKTVSLYDEKGKELLGKSDLINNNAYIVSKKIGAYEMPTSEITILTKSNNQLKEDIKEDIYDLLNKNISPNDTYLKFDPIDFGVDQVINLK